MNVKLVKILQEMDNSNFTTELARYYKAVELLMDPQRKTLIKVGKVKFFIDQIVQDINLGIVVLYEFKNIHYRDNYNSEGFKKEKDFLLKNGWNLDLTKKD